MKILAPLTFFSVLISSDTSSEAETILFPCDVREFFCNSKYEEVPAPKSLEELNDLREITICIESVDGHYRIENILEGNMDREKTVVEECPIRVDNTDPTSYNFVQPFKLNARQDVKQDVVRNYNPLNNAKKLCAMNLCQLTAPINHKFLAKTLDNGGQIQLSLSGVVQW